MVLNFMEMIPLLKNDSQLCKTKTNKYHPMVLLVRSNRNGFVTVEFQMRHLRLILLKKDLIVLNQIH